MRIFKLFLSLVASFVLVSACSKEPESKPIEPIATKETPQFSFPLTVLDNSIVAFSAIANKPLPTLALSTQTESMEVRSCQEFVNNIGISRVVETIQNMHVYADYQQCLVSWLFERGNSATTSFLEDGFSAVILDQLDLSSFPSSLGPRLDENKNVLSTFSFANTTETADKIVINDEGWSYEYTLLARGDFNGDNKEDFVVRFLDQAGDASYFSVQTLLIEKTSKESQATVINVSDLLKQSINK